jgi:hypothetical protein
VIVIVAKPVATPEAAVSVKVLLALAGLGSNAAVTPLGSPEAVRLTFPANPLTRVIVIVVPTVPPCEILKLSDVDSEKSTTPLTQLLTRLKAFTVPITVAKSQPVVAANDGWYALFEVESTPYTPEGK